MYLGKYINILTDFDPCSSRRVKCTRYTLASISTFWLVLISTFWLILTLVVVGGLSALDIPWQVYQHFDWFCSSRRLIHSSSCIISWYFLQACGFLRIFLQISLCLNIFLKEEKYHPMKERSSLYCVQTSIFSFVGRVCKSSKSNHPAGSGSPRPAPHSFRICYFCQVTPLFLIFLVGCPTVYNHGSR